MADRYTVVYGNDIKDGTVTETELSASVAGVGLSGGAGSPLAVDLDELTAEAVAVAEDSIAIIDATDGSTKKESIADLATGMAGAGLTATNGVFSVDQVADGGLVEDYIKTSEVDGTTIEFAGGNLNVVDGGIGNAKLTDDSILEAKLDATNAPTDGYFLTYDSASGGFTWVESPATSGVQEADIVTEDFTASINGVLTDFTLTDVPLASSLQVFIDGIYRIEGSGKDFVLNPDSGQTKTIRINGDVLVSGQRLVVCYVKDN